MVIYVCNHENHLWTSNFTLLRLIPTMAFQRIPCFSTNLQLRVPLQDSQHCFIWSKVFGETDAQFTRLMIFQPYLMRFFLAFEVRRGTLCSGARGWGPAGNALILSLQLGSGGGRRRKDKEGRTDGRKERGGQADIKSNNPHLTGGEKGMVSDPENVQPRNPTRSGDLSQTRTVGPFCGCEYIHIYIYIHTHWSYTCTYLCFWILSWFFSIYVYIIYIYTHIYIIYL